MEAEIRTAVCFFVKDQDCRDAVDADSLPYLSSSCSALLVPTCIVGFFIVVHMIPPLLLTFHHHLPTVQLDSSHAPLLPTSSSLTSPPFHFNRKHFISHFCFFGGPAFFHFGRSFFHFCLHQFVFLCGPGLLLFGEIFCITVICFLCPSPVWASAMHFAFLLLQLEIFCNCRLLFVSVPVVIVSKMIWKL